MKPVKITYYLEVMSSWCYWSEPSWAELKRRYSAQVDFEWKIAQMQPSEWPVSVNRSEWYYRRSGMVVRSPFMLNSGWWEPYHTGSFPAANYVAEAAKDFGFTGDDIRLALSHASEREGTKVGKLDIAVDVAVSAAGGKLTVPRLKAAAESAEVRARVDQSTKEFFAHQINQRPAYIITDEIGDKAVFSGLVRVEPLAAAIDAMLADTAAYASHRAHFGDAPKG